MIGYRIVSYESSESQLEVPEEVQPIAPLIAPLKLFVNLEN